VDKTTGVRHLRHHMQKMVIIKAQR